METFLSYVPPEFWQLAGKYLGIFSAFLVVLMSLMMIWIKISTKGKIVCFFQESTNEINQEVLAPSRVVESQAQVQSKRDGQFYFLNSMLLRNIRYPGGLPSWMQEYVPAQMYTRGLSEPVEWQESDQNLNPAATTAALMAVKQTAHMKAIAEEIQNKYGANSVKKLQGMMTLGLVILAVIALVGTYFSYQNYQAMKDLVPVIQGMQELLKS